MLSLEVQNSKGSLSSTSSEFAAAGHGIRFPLSPKNDGSGEAIIEKQINKLVERFYTGCTRANCGKLKKEIFTNLFAKEDETSKIWFNHFYDKICREKGTEVDGLDVHAFTEEVDKFLHLSDEDRIDYTISLFDLNRDGFISSDELLPLVKASFVTTSLKVPQESLQKAVDAVVQTNGSFRDIEKSRGLTYAECKSLFGQCLKSLGAGEDIDEVPAAHSAAQKKEKDVGTARGKMCTSCASGWQKMCMSAKVQCRDNTARVVWLSVYVFLNVVIFIAKFLVYQLSERHGPARDLLGLGINFARAFGQVAVFNMMLIFWPVCRKLMGYLRDMTSLHFWRWIPFNDNITFHMMAGHMVMLAGLAHTGAHLYNFYLYNNEPNVEVWENSPFGKSGAFDGPNPSYLEVMRTLPGLTGHILLAIMLIAYPCSIFLRRRNFNMFWYTHNLFLVFTIVFMIHGAQSWLEPTQAVWYTLPGFAVYLLGRIQRKFEVDGNVEVVRASTFDNTTVLWTRKPRWNKFRFSTPGSYALLNIPEIAKFEWHPFTISSAPSDELLRFHIRNAGDWTGQLWNYVNEMESKSTSNSEKRTLGRFDTLNPSRVGLTNESLGVKMNMPFTHIRIHGPNGAPTQDYLRYERVVLVGAGIGVTPFASILREIMAKWRSKKCECCGHINRSVHESDLLKRVQFHWVTREQTDLSWFAPELSELASMDSEGRLEIHQHITGISVTGTETSRSLVETVQRVAHEKQSHDIISGITGAKQLTHFGRPHWKTYLRKIAQDFQGKRIGVFYCGPTRLENVLRIVCRELSESYLDRKLKFVFSHENF